MKSGTMFIEGKPPHPVAATDRYLGKAREKKHLVYDPCPRHQLQTRHIFIYFLHTLFSEKKPTNCFETWCLSKIPLKEMKINCRSPPSCVNIYIPALIAITL